MTLYTPDMDTACDDDQNQDCDNMFSPRKSRRGASRESFAARRALDSLGPQTQEDNVHFALRDANRKPTAVILFNKKCFAKNN